MEVTKQNQAEIFELRTHIQKLGHKRYQYQNKSNKRINELKNRLLGIFVWRIKKKKEVKVLKTFFRKYDVAWQESLSF